jgi:hypothetical protein
MKDIVVSEPREDRRHILKKHMQKDHPTLRSGKAALGNTVNRRIWSTSPLRYSIRYRRETRRPIAAGIIAVSGCGLKTSKIVRVMPTSCPGPEGTLSVDVRRITM